MLSRLLVIAVLAFCHDLFLLFARAQVTTSAVCRPSYAWSANALAQSPCLVASYLESVCNNGQWDVAGLEITNSIYPGGGTLPCQCNPVVYSLISACGACQGHDYVSWKTWTSNCSVTYTNYPEKVPRETQIPPWATLSISENDSWNETLARQTAGDSSPLMTSTTSITTETTSTSTPTPVETSRPDTPQPASTTRSQLAVIVGGVVGTFSIIGILFAALFWCWRKRRRRQQQQQQNYSPPLHGDAERGAIMAQVITVPASAGSRRGSVSPETTRPTRSSSAINMPSAQALGPYGPYTGRAEETASPEPEGSTLSHRASQQSRASSPTIRFTPIARPKSAHVRSQGTLKP